MSVKDNWKTTGAELVVAKICTEYALFDMYALESIPDKPRVKFWVSTRNDESKNQLTIVKYLNCSPGEKVSVSGSAYR